MTNEKLTELLKIAYRWGRENGSNRSDKNFNDLLQTEAISQALRIHDVSGMLCGSFDPDNKTSSATKCKCGREKWEHPKPRN